MKVFKWPLILACLAHVTVAQDTITLPNGDVFENASIEKADEAHAKISHRSGIARVKLSELPEKWQKKLGYDSAEAKEFIAAKKEAKAEREKQERQANWLKKHSINASIEILQIMGNDARGSITETTIKEESYESPRSSTRFVPDSRLNPDDGGKQVVNRWTETKTRTVKTTRNISDNALILGIGRNRVDGDYWSGPIWPYGRFQYTSVMGATTTIPRYTSDPEAALKFSGLQ